MKIRLVNLQSFFYVIENVFFWIYSWKVVTFVPFIASRPLFLFYRPVATFTDCLFLFQVIIIAVYSWNHVVSLADYISLIENDLP